VQGEILKIWCTQYKVTFSEQLNREQILQAVDEGQAKPKFVLMEGAPGIGKSCLAWELCRMWENGATS
jgi:2-phosphoglycerate kinase